MRAAGTTPPRQENGRETKGDDGVKKILALVLVAVMGMFVMSSIAAANTTRVLVDVGQ